MQRTAATIRALGAGALAAGLALLQPLPACALQPLITDDTGTQGKGGNQLELALDRERVRSLGERETVHALSLVYTRGLADSLDAYFELVRSRIRSSVLGDDASGFGNPAVGFKWRLWESEPQGLSIAVKPELQFGVSGSSERRGLGAGRTGYAATLIVTSEHGFGEIHWNASAARVRYDVSENRRDNRDDLYRVSVAPVFTLSPAWKVALDAGMVTNPDRARRARMGFVELGAIWSPHEDLELALGIIALVGDGEPRSRTLTAGLTWRF